MNIIKTQFSALRCLVVLVVLAVECQVVAHLVGGDHVEALAFELGERVALDILRLGRKTHDERSRRARSHRRQDVGRPRQRQRQRIAGFLDLFRRALHRAVVRDGGGRDEDVGVGHVLVDGVHHLLGRFHVDASHAWRCRYVDRSADEHHFRTGLARGLGHGEAHFAGAAVGDETHRIDAFPRRSSRDHDLEPRQRAVRRTLWRERVENLRGLEHSAGAGFAAGLVALGGPEHRHAARAQQGHVGLGSCIGPHQPVHRRRHAERRIGREAQRRQQVIGEPVREPRQEVGAGRRDQHLVGPARKLDVAHGRFGGVVPQVGADRPARQGLERERRDELARAGGHHDQDLRAAVAQSAHQLGALVRGDAARDAQQDAGRCLSSHAVDYGATAIRAAKGHTAIRRSDLRP